MSDAPHARAPDGAAGATTAATACALPRSASAAVTEADLPESIARLVRATVRRTRLRRRERRDVACELVSHFEAGLDAGVAPGTLVADFGRPRHAARLLRTAARRRRRRLDRAFTATLRWTGSAVAAAAILYAALAVRVTFLEPTIAFDGFARLRRLTPSVPDGGGAWPIYRDALGWDRGDRLTGGTGAANRLLGRPWGDPPSDADRAEAARTIRARAAEIDRLRTAAATQVFGWPIGPRLTTADQQWFGESPPLWDDVPDTLTISLQMPHVSELRAAARLLAADASLAAADGDGTRAAADLAAILGVARHAGELPLLINQLVESSILGAAAERTIEAMERTPAVFSDADLGALAAAFAAVDPGMRRLDLTGERVWLDDVLQHVYSDDGSGDGVLLLEQAARLQMAVIPGQSPDDFMHPAGRFAAGPAVAGVVAGRAETRALADELYGLIDREAALPILDRPGGLSQRLGSMASSRATRLRHPVLITIMPAIDKAAQQRSTYAMSVDAARVVIALEQWRREHGGWPASLDALVPDRLPAVPRDAFDGLPLRYRLDPDQGPRLWSIGQDGEDDGGRMALNASAGRPVRAPLRDDRDADLVFFAPASAASSDATESAEDQGVSPSLRGQ